MCSSLIRGILKQRVDRYNNKDDYFPNTQLTLKQS